MENNDDQEKKIQNKISQIRYKETIIDDIRKELDNLQDRTDWIKGNIPFKRFKIYYIVKKHLKELEGQLIKLNDELNLLRVIEINI